jgi:cytoskeletal protein CcmA (bactofilin family)
MSLWKRISSTASGASKANVAKEPEAVRVLEQEVTTTNRIQEDQAVSNERDVVAEIARAISLTSTSEKAVSPEEGPLEPQQEPPFLPQTVVLEEGVKLTGNLFLENGGEIQGEFHGDLSSCAMVTIAKQGIAQCRLMAKNVVIKGILSGEVESSESILLTTGAKVEATLIAPELVIESGAEIRGYCKAQE